MIIPDTFRPRLAESTRITGMVVVRLVCVFFAREYDLFGIDHDDMVTRVQKRCIGRFVLARENGSDPACQTSKHDTFSIDDVPGTLDFLFLCECG